MISANEVRSLYFTATAYVHNNDQGKDYPVEVEINASVDYKGRIVVEQILEKSGDE